MKKIFILFICMTFMMSLFSIGIGVQGGVSIDIWEGKTVNTGASGEGAVTIRFAEDIFEGRAATDDATMVKKLIPA